MEESGIYSIVLGLISIGISIYFIENLIFQVGTILIIITSVTVIFFKEKTDQIEKNRKAIIEFDKKLQLHNRLNKIENDIKIIRGVKKDE